MNRMKMVIVKSSLWKLFEKLRILFYSKEDDTASAKPTDIKARSFPSPMESTKRLAELL